MNSAHDYDDPGKPKIAWNDQTARVVLVDALVRDALAVLGQVAERPAGSVAADAVGLLALVAGRDVELVEDHDDPEGPPPHWRIARSVAPDRLVSVVDPEARHAHKTVHAGRTGSRHTWRLSPRPA